MMPGTSTVARPESATVPVAELTGSERAVALYASDMPNRRVRATSEQYAGWIAQGLERLGGEEVRRRAAFAYGFKLLELSRVVTAQARARHEQRFPKARRLEYAEQAAANTLWRFEMSAATRARNAAAAVDGECACAGTGSIAIDCGDPDLSYALACPVHGRIAYTVGRIA